MLCLRPRRLEPADYRTLVDCSKIIERDGFGEKVLQTPDGLMVKIFRRKRLLTTATVFPYALRFVRNVTLLSERGVATVEVLDYAYCPPLRKHLVIYRPLPGMTVRQALQCRACDPAELLTAVSRFVADLHRKGIYFRSLHFGNIIVSPGEGQLGLIDVADMTFRRWSLGSRLRERNFRHMLRYHEDTASMREFGWSRFIELYLEAAHLSPRAHRMLVKLFENSPNGLFPEQISP
ncbi:MAG: hypothetical protein NDI73_08955 [Desulfuromonadales bacterium]|nr:hypothetical protein [Desulfuromonadales bacterium]